MKTKKEIIKEAKDKIFQGSNVAEVTDETIEILNQLIEDLNPEPTEESE